MINMIKPETISFQAKVTEDEIRERMAMEVLQQIGALDDAGKVRQGITYKVTRGPDSRKGGYVIEVTGPVPVQMFLPKE